MEDITLPIFPLRNMVFFPRVLLPLHIYEIRYQQMITHLLNKPDNQQLLVIANLNYKNKPRGKNPFESIATVGKLIHHEPLDDGKSNIVLYGQFTADVEEVTPSPYEYRMCKINNIREEFWNQPLGEHDEERERIMVALENFGNRVKMSLDKITDIKIEDLINALSFSLNISLEDKQCILEEQNFNNRLDMLIELINQMGYYKPYDIDFDNVEPFN